MFDPIRTIVETFEATGHSLYGGEAVTQLEHALQCATLALHEGAPEPLVTACLLHDYGHLVHDLGGDAAGRGVDDRHEYRALRPLRRLYGEQVTAPIRLHVEAKRYLCAVRPGYYAGLSDASRRSLALQGGPFTLAEAEAFSDQPYAEDAVHLRLWDDRAKTPFTSTPKLAYYVNFLERSLK